MTTVKKLAYVLPDKLSIQSIVNPEKRYRGIYQVMLYSSDIKISGKFNEIPLQQLKIDPAAILWRKPMSVSALTDAKGLKEEIKLNWNDSAVTLNPSSVNNAVMREAFTAPVNVEPGKEINFSSVYQY